MAGRQAQPKAGQEGFTLVELLVAMVILSVFFSVFMSVAVKLFDSTINQQARSGNIDVNRFVVQVLDRQVRYANAINTPVVANGSRYVEWQSGSFGRQQTCVQWRVTAGGLMQRRSWLPRLTPASPAPVPTAWSTVGYGIRPTGALPIFSIDPPAAGGTTKQQLTLRFSTRSGVKPVETPTSVAFTAINTLVSTPPATPVCVDVVRP